MRIGNTFLMYNLACQILPVLSSYGSFGRITKRICYTTLYYLFSFSNIIDKGRGGEIGRHAVFRTLCSQELGGSNPPRDTLR